MCKVVVHDYKAGKDVWFGPYQGLEIHATTIWAMNESGRKEELASLDSQGFWFVRDDNMGQSAYGRTIRVSVDAKIKAADIDVPPEGLRCEDLQ